MKRYDHSSYRPIQTRKISIQDSNTQLRQAELKSSRRSSRNNARRRINNINSRARIIIRIRIADGICQHRKRCLRTRVDALELHRNGDLATVRCRVVHSALPDERAVPRFVLSGAPVERSVARVTGGGERVADGVVGEEAPAVPRHGASRHLRVRGELNEGNWPLELVLVFEDWGVESAWDAVGVALVADQ